MGGQAWRRSAAIGAAALLGSMVACSGSEATGDRLVDYVAGDWGCELVIPAIGGPVAVDGTVEASDVTHGEIMFVLGMGSGRREYRGEWRRDGGSLDVDLAGASYAIDGVELDTDKVTIQEAMAAAELQEVGVERDGDRVTLSWADPWTGDDVTMGCTKR